MHVRRWLLGLVSPLALLVLPACGGNGPLLPLRDKPTPDGPPPVQTTSGKARPSGQFAVLPRAPGETISLHPVSAAPQPPPVEDPPTTAGVEPDRLPGLDIALEDPTPPLVRALQAFHDDQPERAIEHLKGFTPANQELLLQLIPAVVQASRANLTRPDADESAALARQFESAAAAVLKRAGLTVRKGVLCLAVDKYGVYTPVRDRNTLTKDSLYSIYLEVGNVPCVPVTRPDGVDGYQVRLECEMRVADEHGAVVEIVDVKTGVPGPSSKSSKSEFSRSPVHDYFVAATLQTPGRPGAYTVTFEVRDPRTGQSVSKPIPFRVQ